MPLAARALAAVSARCVGADQADIDEGRGSDHPMQTEIHAMLRVVDKYF